MKFREMLLVLLLAVLVTNGPATALYPQRDFWDQFPDMWRGAAPASGLQQADISRRSRFEDWRSAQRSLDFPSANGGSRGIHDAVRDLFSGSSTGGSDGFRNAMISLGVLGNVQPQFGRGEFSFSSLFPEFQMSLAKKDWWKGSNVCVERKEEDLLANITANIWSRNASGGGSSDNGDSSLTSGDGSIHINSCSQSPENEVYTCMTEIRRANFHRRYTVRYQCCYGFSRDGDSGLGCTKAIPMTSLPETLVNLKLTVLAQLLSDMGMLSLLDTGNFTIFAPNNDAFGEFQLPSNEIASRRSSLDMSAVLKSHLIAGLVRSSDFTDDQLLSSVGNSTIRINLFTTPSYVVTADCARVVSINNLAKNGVVHIVDRIVPPVKKNLEMALRDDGRFGTLMQLLDDAGLIDFLRSPAGQVTLLAPTDEAFRLINREVRNRLSNDGDCLKRVLQSHILPNVICSAVVERNAITTDILNKVVRFDRDVDRLTVQNITVSSADHLATNGMFYVLNGVIIPEEAKSLLHIASDAKLTSYLGLVEKAEIGREIDSIHNVTIFAPSNRAVDRLSDQLQAELSSSVKNLTDVLHYHIVRPSVLLSDFKDNLEMDTAMDGGKLRMNIYEAFPFGKNIITVNCAKITVANLRGCEGTIHVLEKLLIPPKGDILQILESSGNFTQLLDGLRKSGLDRTLHGRGPFTIFAPSDNAFTQLTSEEVQMIKSNVTLLLSIMQLHIFPRQICCAGIMEDSLFFGQYSRSLNPSYSLPLHRNRYGEIRIAGSRVDKCDVIGRNGVVHLVDKVIFPKNFL